MMNLTSQSTADLLAIELRKLINNGTLRDGDRLVERDLAAHFSVSRIPMREAIRQLEHDGLVDIYRNRGAVVRTLSVDDLDEIYQLRALLEGEAIFHAVKALNEDTLARAELAHSLLASTADFENQGVLNREFHDLLYSGCKNQRLLMLINDSRNQIERYEYLQRQLLAKTQAFQDDHAAILAACQERNAGKARDEVIRHIHIAGKLLKAFVSSKTA
ncbi:GntR family transcriptional regulator [Enterobacter sp. RHBSTW-00175]|uniref:GntR family transcriptional regulator n=1 Tax=Enterobacter sp. RHBSTW-00175 TaxID=2742639 RepID=UPI0021755B85|nr:GntR family transcriptional regulator [Enterobacter sp. RHBSTW-00175]